MELNFENFCIVQLVFVNVIVIEKYTFDLEFVL